MNRHIQALFCDDIRHEVGNKVSYMGVYNGQLLVPQFPTVLPKLIVATTVVTSVDEPFEQLTVRLFKDDKVLTEIKLDDEQLNIPIPSQDENGFPFQIQSFQTVFILSPLLLETPCILKIRAETETKEIQSIGLRVQQMSVNDLP